MKTFLTPGMARSSQQVHIIRMVRPQIAARRRKQALPVLAGPVCQLLFAGRMAEVGRGAADVVDVALEVGMLRHARRLGQQGSHGCASGRCGPDGTSARRTSSRRSSRGSRRG